MWAGARLPTTMMTAATRGLIWIAPLCCDKGLATAGAAEEQRRKNPQMRAQALPTKLSSNTAQDRSMRRCQDILVGTEAKKAVSDTVSSGGNMGDESGQSTR